MSDAASTPSPYSTLPSVGPYDTAIGSALITMVEPHQGREHAYNRWYEDDHFYSGAMAMPWMFAGRRWVAPRDLQELRYPSPSPIADPLNAGCYLAIYWITRDRYEDHLRWTVGTNQRLLPDGRIFLDRTHVFTAFQTYRGVAYRDETGPRDIHSLDHPYVGLVLEVVDAAEGVERDDLVAWLREEHLPARLVDSPAAMALLFEPMPLPPDRMAYVEDVPGTDRRVTILWFLERDPRECWAESFVSEGEVVAASGRGTVVLAAPFLPTIPGTDTYVDQLR